MESNQMNMKNNQDQSAQAAQSVLVRASNDKETNGSGDGVNVQRAGSADTRSVQQVVTMSVIEQRLAAAADLQAINDAENVKVLQCAGDNEAAADGLPAAGAANGSVLMERSTASSTRRIPRTRFLVPPRRIERSRCPVPFSGGLTSHAQIQPRFALTLHRPFALRRGVERAPGNDTEFNKMLDNLAAAKVLHLVHDAGNDADNEEEDDDNNENNND